MKGGKNQNAILIMVLHKVYSSTLLLHAVSRVPCVLCRMPCAVCVFCPKKSPKFLAALSSSRSLVVGWLVGWLVGWSGYLCEKVTFRVSIE